jgi:hypothetical protein
LALELQAATKAEAATAHTMGNVRLDTFTPPF